MHKTGNQLQSISKHPIPYPSQKKRYHPMNSTLNSYRNKREIRRTPSTENTMRTVFIGLCSFIALAFGLYLLVPWVIRRRERDCLMTPSVVFALPL